jgi:hypothetical protein
MNWLRLFSCLTIGFQGGYISTLVYIFFPHRKLLHVIENSTLSTSPLLVQVERNVPGQRVILATLDETGDLFGEMSLMIFSRVQQISAP